MISDISIPPDLLMETYTRQHTVYPDEFPESWASGWGEDEFGLWMEFTYKGVSQKFRWCEPGVFLMGSPEGEAERELNDADETQHEVSLSKGFWMADTAVTQALWQVVMGNNPSRFKGDDRPVENVNWDDAQAFTQRMNEMKPELKLQLPEEAQWEYACRAGSTTPFCWGEQISSELVNYNGEHPYNGGRKSNYRDETIDVESFYQNDWGLWQMHGNVLEWCQDQYGRYIGEITTDSDQIEPRALHVLRGGSWLHGGRNCRSAYRNSYLPVDRGDYIGFRLVRGH